MTPARRSAAKAVAPSGGWAKALVAFTLAVAGIASSGCGEDAGSQAFAGTQRAIAPGNAYSFRFLAPPWAPISLAMGIYAVIDWDLALTLDLTKVASIEKLPVVLRVETIGGSADAALTARMASLSPPVPSSEARTLGTAAGVHGREVAWRDDSVSFVWVFRSFATHPLSPG